LAGLCPPRAHFRSLQKEAGLIVGLASAKTAETGYRITETPATSGRSHLRPFAVDRISARPGRNERQRAADERDVLHEVLELIGIAERRVADEGRDQEEDHEPERNQSGLIADQHQQAAADLDDDGKQRE